VTRRSRWRASAPGRCCGARNRWYGSAVRGVCRAPHTPLTLSTRSRCGDLSCSIAVASTRSPPAIEELREDSPCPPGRGRRTRLGKAGRRPTSAGSVCRPHPGMFTAVQPRAAARRRPCPSTEGTACGATTGSQRLTDRPSAPRAVRRKRSPAGRRAGGRADRCPTVNSPHSRGGRVCAGHMRQAYG
jgi:hypothetical protein